MTTSLPFHHRHGSDPHEARHNNFKKCIDKKNCFCEFIFLNCSTQRVRQNPKRVSSVSSRDHRHRHPHPHRRRNDPSRPPPPSQFSSPDAGEGPRLPHRNLPHPPDDENEALLLLWLLGEANRSPNNGMRFGCPATPLLVVLLLLSRSSVS